jgi:hypothetical protein
MIKHYFQILCLMGLMATLMGVPGPAYSEDVYTIREVPVDVTADDAVTAREQAIAQAQLKAFQKLIERIVPRWEQPRLADIENNQIAGLVRDFSVNNERRSAIRYVADVTVRFQESQVQRFLNRRDIFYSDQPRPPVLLLPIWRDNDELILWRDPNPWRLAWQKFTTADQNALVPILTPLGDLQDVTKINTAGALLSGQASITTINQFIDRYQASDLLVAVAEQTGPGHRASLYEFKNGRFQSAGRVTVNAGLDELTLDVRRFLTSEWKYQTLRNAGGSGNRQISIYIPHDQFNWANIQGRLTRIDMVDHATPSRFAAGGQLIALSVNGTTDQLMSALRPHGLRLERVELTDRLPVYAQDAHYKLHQR